jgi:hypothetical protein
MKRNMHKNREWRDSRGFMRSYIEAFDLRMQASGSPRDLAA